MAMLEAGPEAVPAEVRQVADLLSAWGVQGWLVGGAVRDLLLGRPTHDFDFAVDGEGLEVARRVADTLRQPFTALDEERGYGRVVVRKRDAVLYLDFASLVGRDLLTDLRQRDFTVNALALSLNSAWEVVDRVGGLEDLQRRVVRMTSPEVFRSDPLRMLRAVRMRAEIGFRIEEGTEALVRSQGHLLPGRVAWERIRDEMCRILAPMGAGEQLGYLDRLGLLERVLPEVAAMDGVEQTRPHWLDVLHHSFQVVTELEAVLACLGPEGSRSRPSGTCAPAFAYGELEARFGPFSSRLREHLSALTGYERTRAMMLKWAALLHDVGKPDTQQREPGGRIRFFRHDVQGASMAAEVAARLRFNRREVDMIRSVVRYHMRPSLLASEPEVTRRAIYRFFRDAGEEGVDVVVLALADHLATWGPGLLAERWDRRLEVVGQLVECWLFRREEVVSPPRLVSGHDLLDLGLRPGPMVGEALEAVREAQVEGEVQSRDEALVWVREWLAGQG